MRESESDLIYNYLHKNYKYIDGDLIRKTGSTRGSTVKKGHRLGSFFYQSESSPRIRSTLNIKGVNYTYNLSHLIYLYHHKYMPAVIEYSDKNPTNCRIDNLIESDRIAVEYKKKCRGYSPIKTKNGKTRFRPFIQIGTGKKISFGSCESEEEAAEIYALAKKLYVFNKLDPDEIKKRVMEEFPNSKMKIGIRNKWGFPGVYKRGDRFVGRYKTLCSTRDTAKEAYDDVLRMKRGEFERVNHYQKPIKTKIKQMRPNKTGFAGVKSDHNRFSSRYKAKHLGMFDTAEEAHAAYLKAKDEH